MTQGGSKNAKNTTKQKVCTAKSFDFYIILEGKGRDARDDLEGKVNDLTERGNWQLLGGPQVVSSMEMYQAMTYRVALDG